MEAKLRRSIKDFITGGITIDSPRTKKEGIPFWRELAATGTELWLDTGDIDEAKKLWTADMSALTTNNTLLNNEIQKGIYDDLIVRSGELLKGMEIQQKIIEIAFILNARHALRLVEEFGGKVSVELHTDMAHDVDRSVEYADRFFEICPENFIIKIPLTPAGFIATRKIREKGIPVNFTLNFSARQNLVATIFSKPSYVNIFLGRQNAYVQDNGLGDGMYVGEKSTLASQRVVAEYSKNNPEPTRQIAASLRDTSQVSSLAGVDVFTIPTRVATASLTGIRDKFISRRDKDYAVHMDAGIEQDTIKIEKLWNYTETEHNFAHFIDDNNIDNPEELIKIAHSYGLHDLFPVLSDGQMKQIASDGKIPVHKTWTEQIKNNSVAIDSLLNLAGLASFSADQMALDGRIKSLLK